MTRAILHAIAVSLLVFVVWIVSGAVYALFGAYMPQSTNLVCKCEQEKP
jgi:hypothetical protein